jgi:hypothetical protein
MEKKKEFMNVLVCTYAVIKVRPMSDPGTEKTKKQQVLA